MKSIFFALLLCPVLSFANDAPFQATYTCDGHELVAGNAGQTGTVVVNVATKGGFVNSPWTFEATWADALAPMISSGMICGAAVERCEVRGKQLAPGELSVREECNVGSFDTRGLPHKQAEAAFVIDGDHGRVFCQHHDAGNRSEVELTNCR